MRLAKYKNLTNTGQRQLRLPFHKYQGTGNDFIVIDDLNRLFPSNDIELIKKLCDRKFGVGSDGILLIQSDNQEDFNLDFINPDGSRSFCGNGSRCAVRFASEMGIIGNDCTFSAIDGRHEAKVSKENIELKMSDVNDIKEIGEELFMDTGSPHHMIFKDQIEAIDVKLEGSSIRYNDHYKSEGVNVNFVMPNETGISVRTYERGVEDETLSCGTGVTASAIGASLKYNSISPIHVETLGGKLIIKFKKTETGFQDIWLCGPAKSVFKGSIEL